MGLTRLPFLSLPPRHPYQTFDLWIRTHSQKDPSQTRGEHYKISKADFMANFTKRNYENDVAVLTLDRPVNFGPSVWPVCLPMLTARAHRVFFGRQESRCWVAGDVVFVRAQGIRCRWSAAGRRRARDNGRRAWLGIRQRALVPTRRTGYRFLRQIQIPNEV